jgi:hypothetical protein
MQGQQNRRQVIIVKQRGNGCLLTLLATLLFGWFGLAAAAAVALTRITWHVGVWCIRATWAATVATCVWSWRGGVWLGRQAHTYVWPQAVKGAQAIHTRYGLRGWAIAGGAALVLGGLIVLLSALAH